MYIAMFFMDITLFYLIPLILSVVLYTLIAIMLLFTAPRTFNDGTVRNQARLQVSTDPFPNIPDMLLLPDIPTFIVKPWPQTLSPKSKM